MNVRIGDKLMEDSWMLDGEILLRFPLSEDGVTHVREVFDSGSGACTV